MKKTLSLFFILGTLSFGSEIIPEYFLMEKTLLPLYHSTTYISGNNRLKAIQVNDEVIKDLKLTEAPFYIYDSNGEKKLVRKGDYIVSMPKLASIYMMKKDDFENNYHDENDMNKSLQTVIDVDNNLRSDIDVDESYGNHEE